MKESTLNEIELAMNDCLDRAAVCTVDSDEDYFRLLDRAERLGKIYNEAQKLENEKKNEDERIQLDRERLDLEKQKYSDDSIFGWQFWAKNVVVPVGTGLILLAAKDHLIMKMAKIASEFEATNTWSTSLGKGVGRFVTDSAQSIMRDR